MFSTSEFRFNAYQHYRGSNAVLGWTHTFGPGLLNELRLGYARGYLDAGCSDCPHPPGSLAGMGIQGVAAPIPAWEVLPSISPANYTGWGDGGYNPDILPDGLIKIEDTLSKIHGRHTIVLGGDFNFWNTLGVQDPVQINSSESFSGQYSSLASEIPGAVADSGLADLELGFPSYGIYTSQGVITQLEGGGWFSLFGQGSIRVTPKLSVQFGMRWEYRKQPYDRHNNLASLFRLSDSYTPGDALLLTALPNAENDALCSNPYFTTPEGTCIIMTSAQRSQYGLTGGKVREVSFGPGAGSFAPRLGVSWRPTNSDKFVVHLGGGIFYDLPETNIMGSMVNNNPVSTRTAAFITSVGAPPVLTNGAPTTTETMYANAGLLSIIGNYSMFMPLPEYFTPTMNEWSATIDSQLMQNLALEVGYNGNRGDHLDNLHIAMNQASPGVGPIQPRRVWPDLGPGWFDGYNNVSTYNALLTSA